MSLTNLTKHRLFWPIAILVVMLAVNAIVTPGFFSLRVQDGRLYGSLIDILRFGAPLILVSIGMTLVIATKGIDLSVGSVLAIAAAVACTHIATAADPSDAGTVVVAVFLALGAAVLLGAWNGFLVSVVGIQPIIATLILMTTGRGIAMLVTGGQIITVNSPPFRVIGAGALLTVPVSTIIAVVVVVAVAVLTRATALGMLIEAVGVNAEASRLAGVNSRAIKWTVYVISAVCAAGAGLIISSNIASADANNAGLWIELDAILAVVIGGTALTGGRYSLAGTFLGALIIQTLTTTVHTMNIPSQVSLVFKAIVVILVCLIQSPAFRQRITARWRSGPRPPHPAGSVPRTEPEVVA